MCFVCFVVKLKKSRFFRGKIKESRFFRGKIKESRFFRVFRGRNKEKYKGGIFVA